MTSRLKREQKLPLRAFGKRSGLRVRPVSIGAMRFPEDLHDAVALVRHAIDSGMRYIDTCRAYGESEWVLGQALKQGYRKKVILSTKWSAGMRRFRDDDTPTADCVRRRLDESLMRLGVDYVDFYQVWNIGSRASYNHAVKKGGMVEGILKAKDEGLVGHIGFTSHDTVDNLLEYIDEADWCEAILTSYNLLDRTYEPVIEAAHANGIATLVMNPVSGGTLAENSPVLMRLAKKVGAKTLPELAIRYVLSNPNVDTILCGMSKISDVDDSLSAAALPGFTSDEIAMINKFMQKRSREGVGFCTRCGYCMPCPQGIDIPGIMSLVYSARYLGFKEQARRRYAGLKVAGDACTECGRCVSVCTQHLDIPKQMAYAHRSLRTKKN